MFNELALRAFVAVAGLSSPLNSRFRDEDGQTLAEYGLILSVVAVAVVAVAFIVFRDAIKDSFVRAADCVSGAAPCIF